MQIINNQIKAKSAHAAYCRPTWPTFAYIALLIQQALRQSETYEVKSFGLFIN